MSGARGKVAASAVSLAVLGLCWHLGSHARAQVAEEVAGQKTESPTPAPVQPTSTPTPSETQTATPDEPSVTPTPTAAPSTSEKPTTPASTTALESTTPSPGAFREGRYLGQWVPYKYGQLRVSVDVAQGKIVNVVMNQRITEDKSDRVNKAAHVALRAEVIAAQSSKVSTVTGATYTSQAYRTSLQYALDSARPH